MTELLRLLYRAGQVITGHPPRTLLRVRMAGWICVLALAVKVWPLPRVLAMVSTPTRPPSARSPQDVATALAHALDPLLAMDRLIFRPSCWKRAAILHRYLALNGIATHVVFGVRRGPAGVLSGHAWLEADGAPLLERVTPDHTVVYTFPSAARVDLGPLLATITG